jgi:spore coat protein JB
VKRVLKEENMDMMKDRGDGCRTDGAPLPACGRLAAAYVPMQPQGCRRYSPEDALAKGTLFPGLDLPWMNVANTAPAAWSGTPLGELMSLNFVVQELGLYLDTHPEDREALRYFTEYASLLKQGKETFISRYGPLRQTQVTREGGYNWIGDPWPWEYAPGCDACERRDD